ncbi:MAG: hypothetical protein DRN90_02070 [Thermoproteota archaeon]|nr:MAG: hypothetical protein DRG83_04680 [Deltaproteobacteria bacterium]RLG49277.1 MAG: hypothetical protein DRN90_02070 [Candidatus Korarchaeota archaeon]
MKKVAYILDVFPQLSETFIINEILELIRHKVDVVILSRRKPEENVLHPGARDLIKRTYYLDNRTSTVRKLLLHLRFLLFSPDKYMKTFLFSYKRKSTGAFWYFKESVIYAEIIKKVKPEHIHSHYAASSATEFAMLVSMLTGIPFTFTAHGWYDIFTSPPSDFDLRAEKAKAVVTVSNFNRSYIHRRFHVPLSKIHVIYCGIDLSFFRPDMLNNDKGNIILSVARLHPVKGLEYLLKACGILKEKEYSFKCIIVGEGPERGKLESLISELQLCDYVELVGNKTQDKVLEYYRQAKIFVLPSIYEAMGVATMEAMACKVPVVATRIWGVPELVDHGKNGFLVPPKDPQQLAEAIETLLTDSDLRRRFGEQGRLKVERKFSLKDQAEGLLRLWEET